MLPDIDASSPTSTPEPLPSPTNDPLPDSGSGSGSGAHRQTKFVFGLGDLHFRVSRLLAVFFLLLPTH
jgi:hypothetical protein